MPKPRVITLLLCGALLLQATGGGLLIWDGDRLLADGRQEYWQATAREHCRLLVQTLAPVVAAGDHSRLLNALSQLHGNDSVRYAAVFNPQQVLQASFGEPLALAVDAGDVPAFTGEPVAGLLVVEQPIAWQERSLGRLQVAYRDSQTAVLLPQWRQQALAIGFTSLLLSGLCLFAALAAGERGANRLQRALGALQREELDYRLPGGDRKPDAAVEQAFNALAVDLQTRRTEWHRRYERLQQDLQRLTGLLEGTNAIVWELDPERRRFRCVSAAAERLLGYPLDEWLEPDFWQQHLHPDDLDWVQAFLFHKSPHLHHFTLDFRIRKRDEEYLWLRMINSLECDDERPVPTGLMLNVTDEKISEKQIAYLSCHDIVTGLFNRRYFYEQLEQQIVYDVSYDFHGALLLLNLDQFKSINETCGYFVGDRYLQEFAAHLRRILLNGEIVGRLDGDEFGVIFPNARGQQIFQIGDQLISTLRAQEFVYDERRSSFNVSMGIVLFPRHGEDADDLLAKANVAVQIAKQQGRNSYCIYEERFMTAEMQEKGHWEEHIQNALKEDRFRLYFQPIVDIMTGAIVYYETLLRMIDEDGAVIAPDCFIAIAERSGFIREIDTWVITNAIRMQGESMGSGKPVTLTINLSGRNFGNPQILELIQEMTRRYKANPTCIVFEVTETAAMTNMVEAADFIRALREMRYRVSLDDFGTGFSSFGYLKQIQVDAIKIDGSFVRNLDKDEIDQLFVKAIADIASSLGVKTVAEFVENERIVEILRELGVNLGQGYYFGKPTPHFAETVDRPRLVLPPVKRLEDEPSRRVEFTC